MLLLQQAIAQMGMDLSRADTAIYFSEPAGYLAKAQTEDRIIHPEKSSPLLYISLVVKDSVDADLHSALRVKGVSSSLTLSRALKKSLERRWKR